jgi:RNA polymerase sigma-70 factor (ECF subfamily)
MASGMICTCLSAALSDLPARQRTAITLIELEGKDPAEAAAALGISAINLKVIRHRGRMALRKRLESVCQACAGRSCVDCDCKPSDPPQSARTAEGK